jgi:predicted aspartyl protease
MRFVIGVVCCVLVSLSAPAAVLEIPFTVSPKQAMLLVEVRVDGHPLTFLLDTGSTFTVIDHALLGIPATELKKARFARGGVGVDFEAIVTPHRLQIGARTFDAWHLLATDIGPLAAMYGRRIDGVLGQDALSRFRTITIDFVRRVLILTEG